MRPLADITILAIEQYGAGPFASLLLADLGADVIKIEDPSTGGDVGRYVPPFNEGEDSLFYQTFNRNKRSISLDLRSEAGRSVFERLVAEADVVFSNLRGDVPAKLGITYEDLAPLNPGIVCASLSGFGIEGATSDLPGYDYIFQGLAGWMSLTGDPDGPPTKSGVSLVDFSGGLVAGIAILSAVHAARRDGVGSNCDLSLYDVATALLTYDATWTLNTDWEPTRRPRSAHPSLVPFQVFQGADEEWFVVACAKEKFWDRLRDALDDERLADDRLYGDFEARDRNREELVRTLDSIFSTRAASEWLEHLGRAGVPVGPVRSVREALESEETDSRSLIIEVDHDAFGTIRQVRSPVRVGSTDEETNVRAPHRGEHQDQILADLGYSEMEVEELVASGAFG